MAEGRTSRDQLHAQLEARTRELAEAQRQTDETQRQADKARRQLAEAQRQASEALEQQAATSEVLQVISSSSGDLEPVFQAVLVNAIRICEAKFGTLFRYDDGAFHAAAMHNVPSALAGFLGQRGPFVPPAGTPLDRLLRTKKVIRSIDQAAEKVLTPSTKLAGARSHIVLPC